jgi:membrane protease YdiL (CAAX protease family)
MKRRKVFLVWFCILLVWSFYRAYFRLPEVIDELLVKPIVFAFPILYLVVVRENKSLKTLGLMPDRKSFMLDVYIGVVLGIIFALEGLFANYVKYGTYSFSPLPAILAGGGLLPFIGINTATSVSEEILGRGFLYNRLLKGKKGQFTASVLSSLLFLLLHIPILFTQLHLTGTTLIIYPLSILLLSITNCYVYSLRGSLVLPILIHTFWNMTVALYL